jgi:hypothetical protein
MEYKVRIRIEDGQICCCSQMCDADGCCSEYGLCKEAIIEVKEDINSGRTD